MPIGRPRTSEQPFLIGDDGFIPLAGGKGIAVVDAQDWCVLRRLAWYMTGNGYAYHDPGDVPCYGMHRAVLGLSSGDNRAVDHVNGDRLDCRRNNLRIATTTENARNRRCRAGRQFKCVYRKQLVRRVCWFAKINLGNKRPKYLGTYATPEAAAHAYDVAAREHFGAFANYNLPTQGQG